MSDDETFEPGIFPSHYLLPARRRISRDALRERASAVPNLFREPLQRLVYPWKFPDRNPMPRIVLFPRLERLTNRSKR